MLLPQGEQTIETIVLALCLASILSALVSSLLDVIRSLFTYVVLRVAPQWVFHRQHHLYQAVMRLATVLAAGSFQRELTTPCSIAPPSSSSACADTGYRTSHSTTDARWVFLRWWQPLYICMVYETQNFTNSRMVLQAPFLSYDELYALVEKYKSKQPVLIKATELLYPEGSRSGESVIQPQPLYLPAATTDAIHAYTDWFFSSSNRTESHAGLLLHGPPGVGKSSLGKHLALRHGLNLVTVADSVMDRFGFYLDGAQADAIVLLDDIDLLLEHDPSLVHYLMQTLETSRSFRFLFLLTTNNHATLKQRYPQLLRRGRIDREILIDLMHEAEARQMCADMRLATDSATACDRIVNALAPRLPMPAVDVKDLLLTHGDADAVIAAAAAAGSSAPTTQPS